MDDKSLKKLIKSYESKGYSKEGIKSAFIKAGYDRVQIDRVLKRTHPLLAWDTIIIMVAVIAIVLFGLMYLNRCQGTECFYKDANKCKAATTDIDIEGSILRIDSKDCILTKQFTGFSDNESIEIVDLLSNKSMTCPYEKGNLSREWIGLVEGIEKCEGSLKDAIYEIRISQIEAEAELAD